MHTFLEGDVTTVWSLYFLGPPSAPPSRNATPSVGKKYSLPGLLCFHGDNVGVRLIKYLGK